METICVVHLVRARNGLEPFEKFLRSYANFRAGCSHDLLFVFKGFNSRNALVQWEKAAQAFNHKSVLVQDWGFDLRAFRRAAEQSTQECLFFLNSFSEILADDWLAKSHAVLRARGVGAAGATGSWESMYTNAQNDLKTQVSFPQRMAGWLRLKACEYCFDPFPNPHLRTNGFMIRRELFLKLWPGRILTKRGAYMFENGRNSFTKRVQRLELKPLIIGRDGNAFEVADWPGSRTFRSFQQENLLIADNQTRQYQQASLPKREWLAARAWGQVPR